MDLAPLLALLDTLDTLDDAALAALLDDLSTAVDELLDDDNVSDDELADAESAAAAIEAVRSEQANRNNAAQDRADRAQALRDRVRGEAEGDGDGGDEGDPAPVDEGDPVEEGEPVTEPVAAGRRGTVSRVAARGSVLSRRQNPEYSPPTRFEEWGLVASANAPGIPAGSPVQSYDQLAQVFQQAYRLVTGPVVGPRTQVSLVRAGNGAMAEFGERRTLDSNAVANASKIRDVVHPQAITAAGGWCVPTTVQYDMPVVGSTARPVRDTALARFGADRGGIRTFPSPVLADVTGAIGVWTQQDDIDASGNTGGAGDVVKPCITLDCPTEVESIVQAITACFKTGNFRQRFFPEQIEAVMRLIAVAQARIAETALLQGIDAASTQVTTAQLLGTVRDVLPYLDQTMAGFRDRWRLDDGERMRWVAPRWLRDEMRADLARSMPAGTVDETLAVADAQINAWLSARNVNVTWALEAAATSGHFGVQNAGALVKWPSPCETYLYPEGAFLFLDGGSLDLGMIRDSTLVATNDLMFFSETSEGLHFQGTESLALTMTLCPDGSVSGTADVNPCA